MGYFGLWYFPLQGVGYSDFCLVKKDSNGYSHSFKPYFTKIMFPGDERSMVRMLLKYPVCF